MHAPPPELDPLERLAGSGAGDGVAVEDWDELLTLERRGWDELSRDSTAVAGQVAHPAQASLLGWRRALERRGLAESANEVATIAQDLHRRQFLDRTKELARPGVGDAAEERFAALAEVDAAEREGEELGLAPGSCGEAELRADLRAGLAEEVARNAPPAATRKRWADHLVDVADDALATVQDLETPPALALLGRVVETLTWHIDHVERAAGRERRRRERRRPRLEAEAEERRIQARLDGLFGAHAVTAWERGVLAAIGLVLLLLLVTSLANLSPAEERALLWADTAVCGFLLWDFAFKATIARWRWSWLRRHVLIDLVPALPFGLVILLGEMGGAAGVGAAAAGSPRPVMLLRVLRLNRVAKAARAFLPALRLARAVGFLLRGCDRIVRSHARLLDRDVILYPTPWERRRARGHPEDVGRAWMRRAEIDRLWLQSLEDADDSGARRLAALRLRAFGELEPRSSASHRASIRRRTDLCVEDLLARLSTIQGGEIEGELGAAFVTRLARGLRLVARSPLRWLPVLHGTLTRTSREDGEVAARFTRALARRLRGALGLVQWFSDLHGTLTPADLVGRVGATLVRRTSRPAVRLLMLGLAYGLLTGAARLFGLGVGAWATRINDLIGTTLLVLGSLCFLLLALGFWLQRIASDASAFYEQVAAAQFLHLTEAIKSRGIERDVALFDARVFGPERAARQGGRSEEDLERFRGGLQRLLTAGGTIERSQTGFDPVARCVLLYRDVLDGALFGESDTRATSQLLGNLALERTRRRAWSKTRAEHRALWRIDLVRRRGLLAGPYVWFNLIARAVAQETARLIVEYGGHALPLDELEHAQPRERRRLEAWLAREGPRHDPDPGAELGGDVAEGAPDDRDAASQLTTAFTALVFLDDSPERDAAIEGRFGPAVLARLRRDRRALYRRVFGAYPLHLLPSEERVLNLRELYRRWAEGGRVLLVPFRLVGLALGQAARGVRFVADAVRRIRDPRLRRAHDPLAETDFETALRKIDRMRGALAREAILERAWCDVEYLGLSYPGGPETRATHRRDLDYVMARPAVRERVERDRASAGDDLRRLAAFVERGDLARVAAAVGAGFRPDREHLRAATVAVRADLDGVRTHLFAAEILADVARASAIEEPRPPVWRLALGLRRAFARWCREHGTSVGDGSRAARRAAWRAVARDVDGARRALRCLDRHGPERARARGEALLAGVLRHPTRATELLVTLRAVQTLSLIDLANYREHVYRLGEYASTGDAPPPPLAR